MSKTFQILAIVPALAGVVVAGEQSPKPKATKAAGCECQAVSVVAVVVGRPTLADRRADRRVFKGSRCKGAECSTRTVEVTETPAIIKTESVYETRKVGQKTTITPAK
jgi:hypothetical protein